MKTFADFGISIPHNKSGEVSTTCPQCSNTRRNKRAACLSVNTEKGVWNCHHCGWTGTLNEGGRKPVYLHWQKPEYKKPKAAPVRMVNSAREWLNNRGITDEVIERNKIGVGTVYMPQLEEEVSAISFPYYRGGELINIKWRDREKHFRLEAGAERILYGIDDIAETTIIVEGEIDKLSVEVAGLKNCVSVPDGAPSEKSSDYSRKFDFLNDGRLDSVNTWVIAVDNDAAGIRLEEELSRRFGRENCMKVVWPEGCKDANEVLLKHGTEVLNGCIVNAKHYPVDGIYTVEDMSESLDNLYFNGWPEGTKTGWGEVDQFYTVQEGQFTVVTGVPSHGKSEWLDAMTINLAEQGWVFGMFSPENQPTHFHMAKLLEKASGARFGSMMSKDQYKKSKEWINAHYHFIVPEKPSLDEILTRARILVRRHGMNGMVIDPWNEIEHLRPGAMSETEYISEALTKVRVFARSNNIHIWLVAHPTKLQKQLDGTYPCPTPYDISGSAHWRNKADNCIAVWRDVMDASKPTQVHVQKVRFRWIGKPGMAELFWQQESGRYTEQASNYYSYGKR
jgi:twinkle protein